MSEIGKEIKRLREERGWSQAQLAVYAGSSQPTVNQIESGKRNPSTRTLEKLAATFGVEVGELFPKAQPPLPEQPELAAQVAAASEPELYELWNTLHDEKMHAELAFRNNPDDPGLRTEYARALEREMYVFMRLSARQLERARAKVGATSA